MAMGWIFKWAFEKFTHGHWSGGRMYNQFRFDVLKISCLCTFDIYP